MGTKFWLSTGKRAVRTMAQTAVATIGVGATGIVDVDWKAVGSVALLSGVLSVLTAIASPPPEAALPPTPVAGAVEYLPVLEANAAVLQEGEWVHRARPVRDADDGADGPPKHGAFD